MLEPRADRVPSPPWGPHRASAWQLRTKRIEFDDRPRVMGIVNVTPDSFSDGGRYLAHEAAVAHALRLADAGADLIDIGGESTRPYSDVVSADEELRRVIPVVEALAARLSIPLSIDTSKARVARESLAAGAELINDVTAATGDPQMLAVARETDAGLCLMHMQGTPRTMQDDPRYHDLQGEIGDYLAARRDAALGAGIAADRIALDPGIGFGKTHPHNLELMASCWRLHALGCPLLVGPSRKGFIGNVLGDKHADRTFGTVGAACALAAQGVQVIRVHDVAAVRQALELFVACGGVTDAESCSPASGD